jgi:hypothetical protein
MLLFSIMSPRQEYFTLPSIDKKKVKEEEGLLLNDNQLFAVLSSLRQLAVLPGIQPPRHIGLSPLGPTSHHTQHDVPLAAVSCYPGKEH